MTQSHNASLGTRARAATILRHMVASSTAAATGCHGSCFRARASRVARGRPNWRQRLTCARTTAPLQLAAAAHAAIVDRRTRGQQVSPCPLAGSSSGSLKRLNPAGSGMMTPEPESESAGRILSRDDLDCGSRSSRWPPSLTARVESELAGGVIP